MTIRIEIHVSINGAIYDEPLGFAELDDRETAPAETAALLRRVAREIDPRETPTGDLGKTIALMRISESVTLSGPALENVLEALDQR